MLQFSLVFMLQEQRHRQKNLLNDRYHGVGNNTILNQNGKTKILSHVASFYPKFLAKMESERLRDSASWLLCRLRLIEDVISPV